MTRKYIYNNLIEQVFRAKFPASGFRTGWAGGLHLVGEYGYTWSSSPLSATEVRGSYLNFFSGGVRPEYNYDYRAFGYPVRCVQE